MDWNEILTILFKVCIIPLAGVVGAYVIALIKSKTAEIQKKTNNELLKQCIETLEMTVINAVVATNQTYVGALKGENAFTVEAQKEAFNKTYVAVMNSLTEDTKKGLEQVTADLTGYVTELIEAKVSELK